MRDQLTALFVVTESQNWSCASHEGLCCLSWILYADGSTMDTAVTWLCNFGVCLEPFW